MFHCHPRFVACLAMLALTASSCAHLDQHLIPEEAAVVAPLGKVEIRYGNKTYEITEAPAVTLDDADERFVFAILDSFGTGLPVEHERATAKAIVSESRKNGLDPYLVLGLIRVESSGSNFARSGADARGLMQIRPFVGKELAKKAKLEWEGGDTLYDPAANVALGTLYVAQLEKKFGTIHNALSAYNLGPTRLRRQLAAGEAPADYADKIKFFAARYRALAVEGDDLAPGIANVTLGLAALEKEIDGKPSTALALVRKQQADKALAIALAKKKKAAKAAMVAAAPAKPAPAAKKPATAKKTGIVAVADESPSSETVASGAIKGLTLN